MKIKAFFVLTIITLALTVILTLNNSLSYAIVAGSDPTPTPVSTESPIRVEEINEIGRGGLFQLIWSEHGNLFANSASGIWTYFDADFSKNPIFNGQFGRFFIISPDNQLFAGGDDIDIKIAEVSTGMEKAILSPTNAVGYVEGISFNADQNKLLAGYSDGIVLIWNLETFQLESNFRVNPSQQMSFSNDGGKLAIITEDDHVQIWDTQTSRMSFDVSIDQWVLNTEFNPESNLLAVSTNQYILLIDTLMGTEVGRLEKEGGEELLFSPNGQMLASATVYGTVTVWDLETGAEKQTLNGGYGVAFSPNSKYLASGSRDGYIRIWDLGTGVEETTLGIYFWEIHDLVFSLDSRSLFFSFGDKFIDSDYLDLRVLDVETGEMENIIQEYGNSLLTTLSISPDGSLLALATQKSEIRIVDSKTFRLLAIIEEAHRANIRSLSFSADSSRLMSLSTYIDSEDTNFKIWDVRFPSQPAIVKELNIEASAAAFNPTSNHLLLSTPKGLMLWDLTSDSEPHLLQNDIESEDSYLCPSSQIVFSSDGTVLLILDECNGHIEVWDAKNWKFLKLLSMTGSTGYGALAISPDNKTLLFGNDLWDIERDVSLYRIENVNITKYAAFSPDGQFLATGSGDARLRLWRVIR